MRTCRHGRRRHTRALECRTLAASVTSLALWVMMAGGALAAVVAQDAPRPMTTRELPGEIDLAYKNRAACGPLCVWYCLRITGIDVDATELIREAPVRGDGVSLAEILHLFRSRSVNASAYEVASRDLSRISTPSVLVLRNHCVALRHYDAPRATAIVFEPATRREERVSAESLREHWDGWVISVAAYPATGRSRVILMICVGILTLAAAFALVRIRGRSRFICAILLLAGLGCADAKPLIEREDVGERYDYDAGRVVEGATIAHTFRYRNEHDVAIRVDVPSGIRSDCQCTRVEVTNPQLEPGQESDILVEIATPGSRGALDKGVTVEWMTADHQPLPCEFRVRAEIAPALTSDPERVIFTRHDVTGAASRTVRFQSDVPVQWNTFQATVSTPHVTIRDIVRDGSGAQCILEVHLPRDVAQASGYLRAEVALDGVEATPAGGKAVMLVHLVAMGSVDARVIPPVVQLTRTETKVAGRFVLSGTCVRTGSPTVRQVRVRDASCVVREDPTASSSLLVSVELPLDAGEAPLGATGTLTVELHDRSESLIVPYRLTSRGTTTVDPASQVGGAYSGPNREDHLGQLRKGRDGHAATP